MNSQEVSINRRASAICVNLCGKVYRQSGNWSSHANHALLFLSGLSALFIMLMGGLFIETTWLKTSLEWDDFWSVGMMISLPLAILMLFLMRWSSEVTPLERFGEVRTIMEITLAIGVAIGFPIWMLSLQIPGLAKYLSGLSLWSLLLFAGYRAVISYAVIWQFKVWSMFICWMRQLVLKLALLTSGTIASEVCSDWDDERTWKALEMALLMPTPVANSHGVSL